MRERVAWDAGTWTSPPAAVSERDGALVVTAVEGSDAWRRTAYGFIHDTEHALIAPLPVGTAMEVVFEADFTAQFDQAGLFVRADDERWMKAGVENADGVLGVGAVVTDIMSDWSVGAVPEWAGRPLRVRVAVARMPSRCAPASTASRCVWCGSRRSAAISTRRQDRWCARRRAPASRSCSPSGCTPTPTRRCTDHARGSYRRSSCVRATRSRSCSSSPSITPAARAWIRTLPSAVASTGPATTGTPHRSAVR